ncbi:MAG: SDR family oxidoreductase [Gammaproteobacteria bacterium]|nr:SDR family oxidoreductase [Gammaproteobacteria bacterium]
MDLGIKDNAYIVVGGTRGMGWEAARRLAQGGAALAIIGRTASTASARAAQLGAESGARVIGLGADASRRGEVERAVERALAELGTVRGLLATPGSTDRNGTLLAMSDDDWEANFHDVLMSQVRSCRAILPHLLENGGGQLVTTAAYSARSAKPFLFAYAAFKAALVNFTKNLCKTYGAKGIRANCVCPGAIETDLLAKRRKAAAEEFGLPVDQALEHVMFEQWKMPVATQAVGKPGDVGDLMAFLLSERAAYMTGATLNIDGGTDF